MRSVILYIAMSLDGYIADREGGVEWLAGQEPGQDMPDSYSTLLERIDTVLLGWNTYHQLTTQLSPEQWPYEGLDCYVFTHRSLPPKEGITFADADFGKLIKDYIRITRQKAVDDTQKSFDDDWVTYAEYLEQQDAARTMKQDGSQKLISETCAIGYNSVAAREGTGEWAYGGACYDGK